MLLGAITFVLGKAITWELYLVAYHFMIAGYLGND